MNARTTPAAVLCLAAACLILASVAVAQDGRYLRQAQPATALDSFVNNITYRTYLLSPIDQTYWGDRTHYSEWDDLSLEAEAERAGIWTDALASLHSDFNYNQLSYQDKITYRVFELYANTQLDFYNYRNHAYLITHRSGPQINLPQVLTEAHEIAGYSDATAYITRLRGIGGVFDQLIERMETSAALGVVPPSFIIPQIITSARNVIVGKPFDNSANDNFILVDFRAKVNALGSLNDAQKAELIAAARDALVNDVKPAYERLIAYLQGLQSLASDEPGLWQFPNGKAYYTMLLRWRTTTLLSPNQVHKRGIRNVRKTHREMKQIMQQVGFESDGLQDFFEFMRTDKRFFFKNTEAGRTRFLNEARAVIDTMETHLPEAFITLPRTELLVKAVEPYRQETATVAFYQPGSSANSRPGIFYVNLYDMGKQPVYELEALAYHEGIPGHHLQVMIADEKNFGNYLRSSSLHTAYVEGWALYAEQLAKEMGFYLDPYSDFGRLSMQLWRACRLVVDTGMHYKGWSRQEAIDYLLDNTPSPEAECISEIDRYVVLPAQATAYMIGKLRILQLRAFAQKKLGDAFDLREFHEVLLTNGSVPLPLLQEIIEDWIANKLSETLNPFFSNQDY